MAQLTQDELIAQTPGWATITKHQSNKVEKQVDDKTVVNDVHVPGTGNYRAVLPYAYQDKVAMVVDQMNLFEAENVLNSNEALDVKYKEALTGENESAVRMAELFERGGTVSGSVWIAKIEELLLTTAEKALLTAPARIQVSRIVANGIKTTPKAYLRRAVELKEAG